MKTMITLFAAGLACLVPALAVEPQKPLVTLTVKRHTLDSDRDLLGRKGSSRQKTVTLRVEIINTTSSPVAESELSGDVLVTRVRNEREEIVREPLDKMRLPAMKPNEKLTLNLGKVELREIEWRNRKSEETLDEWRVSCSQGTTEICKAATSENYQTRLKDVAASKNEVPAGKIRRTLRRIGD
jgi:hypothetical protein